MGSKHSYLLPASISGAGTAICAHAFPAGLASVDLRGWLQGHGWSQIGLSERGLRYLMNVLAANASAPARQAALSSDVVHAVLPHGLMPIGMRDLLRWFIRSALVEPLRLEAIWGLLLEAEAQPEHELKRASAFAPHGSRRIRTGSAFSAGMC